MKRQQFARQIAVSLAFAEMEYVIPKRTTVIVQETAVPPPSNEIGLRGGDGMDNVTFLRIVPTTIAKAIQLALIVLRLKRPCGVDSGCCTASVAIR